MPLIFLWYPILDVRIVNARRCDPPAGAPCCSSTLRVHSARTVNQRDVFPVRSREALNGEAAVVECRAQELLRRTDQSKPHREGTNRCEPNRKKPKFKRYGLISASVL